MRNCWQKSKAYCRPANPMQKPLVSQVIRENKAIVSNDTQNDPRLLFGRRTPKQG